MQSIRGVFRLGWVLAGLVLVGGCARPPADGPWGGGVAGAPGLRAEAVPDTEDAAFRGTDLDDVARYLSGLAGPRGSALTPFRERPEWAAHALTMNELWRRLDTLRRWPIESWSSREMADLRSASTVFYPFSGPDFLFADIFFPGAATVVLCGLETADPLPSIASLDDGQRAESLTALNTALTTALSFSFFITKDMKSDLQRSELKGVLPVMLVFLARGGHTIHSVEAVSLDAGGVVTARGSGAPGFRIRYGAGRTVYYFTTDLSNAGFGDQSRLARLVRSLGPSVAFTKSASYLMHEAYFSNVRNFILGWCTAVLQDDSGIPYREFAPDRWDVRLYGRYSGVLGIFSKYYQEDLAAADAPGSDPLGFGIGYKHNEGQSVMLLARRRQIR